MTTKLLVFAYLAAIVIANLTVAAFGPAVVVVNAFVLVSLDITARDKLHEAWHGDWRRLGALIAVGSLLSAILDYAAIPVALASFFAFALSETADTLVYAKLERYGWYWKTNGSNLASAFVDSAVFLSLLAAFGGVPWGIVPGLVAAQWAAKIAGGAAWAWVLARRRERRLA